MTVCLNYNTETLRSLKALYKYPDREGERERERERERTCSTDSDIHI